MSDEQSYEYLDKVSDAEADLVWKKQLADISREYKVLCTLSADRTGPYRYNSWEDYVMSKTEYDNDTDDETDVRPPLDQTQIAAIIAEVYSDPLHESCKGSDPLHEFSP